MNYTLNKQNQVAIRHLINSSKCDFFITANFNRDTNLENARKALKLWSAKLDRKLVGKHWCKKPISERIFFYAAPEHIQSNLHWHMMLHVPTEEMKERFTLYADDYWRQIVTSGGMDIQLIRTKNDHTKAAHYMTKELWQEKNYNAFTISAEFSGV